MRSMTGYGFSELQRDTVSMTVEIKSYNNRYLDIVHNMPYSLASFEQEIDTRIKTVAARGRVEVVVRLRQSSAPFSIEVDPQAVVRYRSAFQEVAEAAGLALEPRLSDFLSAEGVVAATKETDAEVYRPVLFDALQTALDQFAVAREREGLATCRDLKRLGGELKDGLSVVQDYAADMEAVLKQGLLDKFEELLGPKGYDENRFLQEVAVMLVRYSVNEEIVRLGTHLKEYFSLLDSSEPVGKKLDFLCQEMNREINTIGSKSQKVDVNLQVVRMKDCLENIREQIRNIE